jgi:hypothetical protein
MSLADLFHPPKPAPRRGRIVRLLNVWGTDAAASAQEVAYEAASVKRQKSEARKAYHRRWHAIQYATSEAFREATKERARRTYANMTPEQKAEKMARAKARRAERA